MPRYKKKVKQIDNISMKIHLNKDFASRTDGVKVYMEALEEIDMIAAESQKVLRQWWKTQTSKPFILVVEKGNKKKSTDKYSLIVDLTQLNMDEQTIETFKRGAEAELIKYFDRKSEELRHETDTIFDGK